MFGIDIHSLEVLVPSMIGIIGITAVMIWAGFKLRVLMKEDQKSKSAGFFLDNSFILKNCAL